MTGIAYIFLVLGGLSGFGTPLLLGLVFWGEREGVVAAACRVIVKTDLNSPICP